MLQRNLTKNDGMDTDLIGRIERLEFAAVANVYRPIIEAIHNSLDSIEQAKVTKGVITIRVERIQQMDISDQIKAPPQIVENVVIVDNGIGFTDDNLQSFKTLDSRKKLAVGGKGIGRIFWLKVFERCEIDSVFQQDGKLYRRIIEFTPQRGCIDQPPVLVASDTKVQTTVKLVNFKRFYESVYRTRKPSRVASDLGHHFLPYLLFSKNKSTISLEDGGERIAISKKDLPKPTTNRFTIYGEKFSIHHIKMAAGAENHLLSFCAGGTVVKDIKLSDLDVPVGKKGKIKKSDGTEFHYLGFVTSEFFDRVVNEQRSGFNMDDENVEIDGHQLQIISTATIRERAKDSLLKFLKEDLSELQLSKESRINEVLDSKLSAMKYLKEFNKKQLEEIKLDDTKEEIEKKLTLIHHQNHDTVAQVAESVLQRINIEDPNSLNFKTDLKKFQQVIQVHQADLGQYVLYRAWILEVLLKLCSRRSDNKYELEKGLHSLLFPMQIDQWKGASPTESKHNLWLLDERFAMFDYITSDTKLSKSQVLSGISEEERPDLCCYFFGENKRQSPITNIVLIELKRPGKDKPYSDEDGDPVQQLRDYIDILRSQEFKDKQGRPVSVVSQTKIFCYVICDTENKYVKKLAKHHRMKESFDESGWYDYFVEQEAYIEIISLNKLLTHARVRNKAFFEKLGLPTEGLRE